MNLNLQYPVFKTVPAEFPFHSKKELDRIHYYTAALLLIAFSGNTLSNLQVVVSSICLTWLAFPIVHKACNNSTISRGHFTHVCHTSVSMTSQTDVPQKESCMYVRDDIV